MVLVIKPSVYCSEIVLSCAMLMGLVGYYQLICFPIENLIASEYTAI